MKQINPEPASTKVVVFVRANQTGVLRLDVGSGGTLLSITDINDEVRSSPCQTPEIGRELFLRSMATTIDKGFKVGFVGTPNNARNS